MKEVCRQSWRDRLCSSLCRASSQSIDVFAKEALNLPDCGDNFWIMSHSKSHLEQMLRDLIKEAEKWGLSLVLKTNSISSALLGIVKERRLSALTKGCDPQTKEVDETWAYYCTRSARVAKKMWIKMKFQFLSEVIAESMWRAVGWVCDERPNAVINTLKQVFRWRSTTWWQSIQASVMKSDPHNHTRWKHKCGWHNRGCVWDKLATESAGKEDWMIIKRAVCCALEGEKRFVNFSQDSVNFSTVHRTRKGPKEKVDDKAPRDLDPRTQPFIHFREEGPTVHLCGDSEVAGKWISGHYSLGQKYLGRTYPYWVKHIFWEHTLEADHKANVGDEGQRNIIVDKGTNTERWKAVQGLWDGSSKVNGRSGCEVVIKNVDQDNWYCHGTRGDGSLCSYQHPGSCSAQESQDFCQSV